MRTTVQRGVISIFGTALALMACIAITGCSKGPTVASQSAPEASFTVPPGTVFQVADLSTASWKATSGFHRTKTGPNGSRAFEYLGSGRRAENENATVVVPVTEGTVYVFSTWVDTSHVVGEADLFIDQADGSTTFSSVYQGPKPLGRIKTPPWRCPHGVTRVMLGMQIAQSAVTKGQVLRFYGPELDSAAI